MIDQTIKITNERKLSMRLDVNALNSNEVESNSIFKDKSVVDFFNPKKKDQINPRFQYDIELAKVYLFKGKLDQVIELCDKVISEDPKIFIAWKLRGDSYFLKNNLFDSEESYVKAVKYKFDNKFNVQMLYRLGIVYIRRKTWGDAKTVFLKILKENPSCSFAWRYLGYALTRLEEYDIAEEALCEANLLDVENVDIWAYMCIFCLFKKRDQQALECLNELMELNDINRANKKNFNEFTDVNIIEEIADIIYKKGHFLKASELYLNNIQIDKKNVSSLLKLAEIYFSKIENKKYEAIDILKNSLFYISEEKDVAKIHHFIEIYRESLKINNKNIFEKGMFSNIIKNEKNNDSDYEDEEDDFGSFK